MTSEQDNEFMKTWQKKKKLRDKLGVSRRNCVCRNLDEIFDTAHQDPLHLVQNMMGSSFIQTLVLLNFFFPVKHNYYY